MPGLFQEIKRRNVFKVAIVYLIAGWLTMQIVDVMFPALNLPEWLTTAIAAFLLLGFPFALILAWAFEITPDGIKLEKDVTRDESITPRTGQKLNKTAFVILGIAVGFLLVDKFFLQGDTRNEPPAIETAASKPSIAVLPFVNMSSDAANEYFSDGLSEELLNLLAKIPNLHVAGRTSSFQFKDATEDLRQIGEQLNVAHVLEGSVRKSGSRLRITAQLIDTATGFHLWSETYDRDMTDIFAVQDEISAQVVAALKLKLLGEDTIAANRGTDNTEAYNLFLQGSYFMQHTSEDNHAKAREAFEKAIELDPNFSRAYSRLAYVVHGHVSGWTGGSGGNFIEGFELVRDYASKAVALDPDDPEAYAVQSLVASAGDWDWLKAQEFDKKALALDPNSVVALMSIGESMFFRSRQAEAIIYYRRLLAIDPLNVAALRALGDSYAVSDKITLAVDTYQHALNFSPESSRLNGRIARAYLYAENLPDASKYSSKEPVDWVRDQLEVMLLGRSGNVDEWRSAAIAYEDKYGLANSYQLAEIYADAGNLDATFKWLANAVNVRDPGTNLAFIVPFFDEARADPRWAALAAEFRR